MEWCRCLHCDRTERAEQTDIEIADSKKAERFVTALEESEKAQAKKKRTAPVIPVMRDANDIRKLMAKRFPTK